MAKIGPPRHDLYTRLPALRGRLVLRTNGRGQLIAQAWPKKRKRPLHPTTQAQNERFRQEIAVSKRVPSEFMIAARSLTHRTALMPRDVLIKAAYGQLVTLHLEDGRIYTSMTNYLKVSTNLDLITNLPGKTLIRGQDFWEGIDFPTAGANWQYSYQTDWRSTTFSGSSYAFKGYVLEPLQTTSVNALLAVFNAILNATYKMVICELDGSDEIVAVVSSDELTALQTETQPFAFPVSTVMTANTRYAIMIGRTDDADDYAMPVYFGGAANFQWPCRQIKTARLASADPAIGQTINSPSSTDCPPLGMALNY